MRPSASASSAWMARRSRSRSRRSPGPSPKSVMGSPSSRSLARTRPSSVGTAIWAARRFLSNCERIAEARSGAMPAAVEGMSYSRLMAGTRSQQCTSGYSKSTDAYVYLQGPQPSPCPVVNTIVISCCLSHAIETSTSCGARSLSG